MTIEQIYNLWEKSGYFNPDKLPSYHKKPFTIIMPPPNANGTLHFGHALFVALQDTMIRFHRLIGRKTLWLPGADHAGFETQIVFDKKLEKEGRNRFKIPREKLWQEMLEFTHKNQEIMESQLRQLGASCDWSRKKFTLGKDIIQKTQESFVNFYKEGLIYRGSRTINWCPKHQTALSDLEVKHIEKKSLLYYIKYGPLIIATVRPETRFGDTALAVHPKDKRYKKYIGQAIEVDTLIGKTKLKVIADLAVQPEFGTGVVKITPAHDSNDFETGQRHQLEIKQVIDRFGRLNELAGSYQGLKTEEARQKVVEDLQKAGLISRIDENYTNQLAVCYKCNTPIEPLVMPQWFMKMPELAKPAIQAIKQKKIKFIPSRFEKTCLHWLNNIRDWNISRQIIWGIRIPAWFCQKCDCVEVSLKPPKLCPNCQSEKLYQDPDVLDTWFSSGQWPFLALGFNKSSDSSKSKIKNQKSKTDFEKFYPTDVMETGYDIIFFWVCRMIMLGLKQTGKIPFYYVYLNGMVRDKDRQKMSKSKGNVIDPLGVAEIYGADAIRMSLMMGNSPGVDLAVSEDKIRGCRNFGTKIKNAAKFVLMHYNSELKTKPRFSQEDKRQLQEIKKLKQIIRREMEAFGFHQAAFKIYHYFWHTFADKIIESAKPRLKTPKSLSDQAACQETLLIILYESIKILHPFMPFVTEEIYQQLPEKIKKQKLLIIEPW